jgi:hypothetical protein
MGKKKKVPDPQLKKDPAFLRRVEHILEHELADQINNHYLAAQTSEGVPIAGNTDPTAGNNPSNDANPRNAGQFNEGQQKRSVNQNKKPKNARKALITELEELIPQLDEAGLEFLVEQARIHLYNMKVDELNSLAQNIGSPAGKTNRKNTQNPGAARPAPVFQIKAGSGGGIYHVSYQGNWKLFSDTEMLAMVRIVQGPGSQEERAARLFRWLRTERRDLLQDIPFQGAQDPLFIEFVSLLQKTFAIRSR